MKSQLAQAGHSGPPSEGERRLQKKKKEGERRGLHAAAPPFRRRDGRRPRHRGWRRDDAAAAADADALGEGRPLRLRRPSPRPSQVTDLGPAVLRRRSLAPPILSGLKTEPAHIPAAGTRRSPSAGPRSSSSAGSPTSASSPTSPSTTSVNPAPTTRFACAARGSSAPPEWESALCSATV